MAVGLAFGAVRVSALSNVAPDSADEYGGGNVYYQLSNTPDVVCATTITIPIYFKTKPAAHFELSFVYNFGTGAGGLTIGTGKAIFHMSGGGSSGPNPANITVLPSSFSFDGSSGYYKGTLDATLQNANCASPNSAAYVSFKVSGPGGAVIGYSASNTANFAVGNIDRCDGGGEAACGHYYTYNLPFAPACALPGGSGSVQIYDGDNLGASGPQSIQPTPFTAKVVDTTSGANVTTSESGSWANGGTRTINFNYTRGGKYRLQLQSVYVNNVLQFKLPFDSIYTLVNCNSPPTGTLKLDCNSADGTGIAHITGVNDPNGSTTSYLRNSANTADLTGPHSGNWDWNPVGITTTSGNWAIRLMVYDIGGSGAVQVTSATHAACAVPNVKVTCNADGTGNIASSYSDPNKTATTTLTFKNGAKTVTRGLPNAAYGPNWPIGATDADEAWTATLVVTDGGRTGTYTDSIAAPGCNLPPVGSVVGASCTADLKGYAYDQNNTAAKLDIYVFVNPPAGTPPSYPSRAAAPPKTPDGFRGPAVANVAPPVGSPAAAAGHGFVINTPVTGPNYAGDWQSNTYAVFAMDNTTNALYRLYPTITQPRCASATCTNIVDSTFGDLTIGSDNSFNVTAHINNASVTPAGDKFMVSIAGPTTGSFTPAVGVLTAGRLTSANMLFKPLSPGNYTMTWTYSWTEGAGGTVSCNSGIVKVGYKPFFTVQGGDTAVGAGYLSGTSCTPQTAPLPGITAWNNDNALGAGYYGAGGTLGAMALGHLGGFATSINSAGSSDVALSGGGTAAAGTGLSFANTIVNAAATPEVYGGSFDSNTCVPDYVANAGSSASPSTGNVDPSTLADGTHYYTGNVDLDGTGGNSQITADGRKVTMVVTGNVYINTNITYGDYSANIANLPEFQLLVKGNIYINGSVATLHGFYDAQPATPGGMLYTCASAANTSSLDPAVCSHQLTVYGAVSAATINLGRTYGNIAPSGTPAENFVYSPELWLAAVGGSTPSSSVGDWDSSTSLPPVL